MTNYAHELARIIGSGRSPKSILSFDQAAQILALAYETDAHEDLVQHLSTMLRAVDINTVFILAPLYTAMVTDGNINDKRSRRLQGFLLCMKRQIPQIDQCTNLPTAEEKRLQQTAAELISSAGDGPFSEYSYLRAHPEAMSLSVDLHVAFMVAVAYINADSDPVAANFIEPATELRQRLSGLRQT